MWCCSPRFLTESYQLVIMRKHALSFWALIKLCSMLHWKSNSTDSKVRDSKITSWLVVNKMVVLPNVFSVTVLSICTSSCLHYCSTNVLISSTPPQWFLDGSCFVYCIYGYSWPAKWHELLLCGGRPFTDLLVSDVQMRMRAAKFLSITNMTSMLYASTCAILQYFQKCFLFALYHLLDESWCSCISTVANRALLYCPTLCWARSMFHKRIRHGALETHSSGAWLKPFDVFW